MADVLKQLTVVMKTTRTKDAVTYEVYVSSNGIGGARRRIWTKTVRFSDPHPASRAGSQINKFGKAAKEQERVAMDACRYVVPESDRSSS
jgi:hypothetical protein